MIILICHTIYKYIYTQYCLIERYLLNIMVFVYIPADVSSGLLGVVAARGSAGILGASEA